MSNFRYALWYEPTGESYTELNATIKKLAALYHSPVFKPHITLLPGGTKEKPASILKKLEKIISVTHPFETHLTSYDVLDEYFKCIFVHIEETPDIMNFAHAIQQEIFGQSKNDFMPHLSILYGKFPVAEKMKIMKKLGKLDNNRFIINRVHIIEYELGKPPESWKKISSVSFKEKLSEISENRND